MGSYCVVQLPNEEIRIVSAEDAENFQKQHKAIILHRSKTYEQAEIWISQNDDLKGTVRQ